MCAGKGEGYLKSGKRRKWFRQLTRDAELQMERRQRVSKGDKRRMTRPRLWTEQTHQDCLQTSGRFMTTKQADGETETTQNKQSWWGAMNCWQKPPHTENSPALSTAEYDYGNVKPGTVAPPRLSVPQVQTQLKIHKQASAHQWPAVLMIELGSHRNCCFNHGATQKFFSSPVYMYSEMLWSFSHPYAAHLFCFQYIKEKMFTCCLIYPEITR